MNAEPENRLAIWSCLLIATLASAPQTNSVSAFYGTSDLVSTSVAQPWTCICVQIAYTDQSDMTLTGVVYASFQNAIGQTVYVATATIATIPGRSATALLVALDLPAGSYRAAVFVTTTTGVPVSTVTTFQVNV